MLLQAVASGTDSSLCSLRHHCRWRRTGSPTSGLEDSSKALENRDQGPGVWETGRSHCPKVEPEERMGLTGSSGQEDTIPNRMRGPGVSMASLLELALGWDI